MAGIAAKFTIFTLLVATAHGSSGFASFSYGVSDPNTGDIKDQHEKREGGNVHGKYSLLESDGTKRVVEYTASDATGFNAVVHKEPAGVAGAVNALGHTGTGGLAAGSLAHGGLGIAAQAVHPAPFARAPIAGPLGAGVHNAVNLVGGYAGHAGSTVSHYANNVVHDVRPYAGQYAGAYGGYGAQVALGQGSYGHGGLSRGALATSFSHGSLGYGHSNQLAGGLSGNYVNGLGGNLAGYAGQSAPAISHYSHSIVHNIRPYAGQYAGAYGSVPLAQNGILGHGGLAAPLANHGYASPLANSGWPSSAANAGWTSTTTSAGWPSALSGGALGSPLAHGFGIGTSALTHGARGANAGWSW